MAKRSKHPNHQLRNNQPYSKAVSSSSSSLFCCKLVQLDRIVAAQLHGSAHNLKLSFNCAGTSQCSACVPNHTLNDRPDNSTSVVFLLALVSIPLSCKSCNCKLAESSSHSLTLPFALSQFFFHYHWQLVRKVLLGHQRHHDAPILALRHFHILL